MTFHRLLYSFLLLVVVSAIGDCHGVGRVVCYVTRTSYMSATAIPAHLCTHIIVAFAEISGHSLVPPSSQDVDFYQKLMKLKTSNSALSVMVSLQKDFTSILSAPKSQKQELARNITLYLTKYGFDGVDFDWEPLLNPTLQQKQGYMDLIQIVRQTLDKETHGHKQTSAALMPSISRSQRVYDVPALAKVLDFATAMTYDYHLYIPDVDNNTAYNSPLYAARGERKDYCVAGTIQNYLALGMPASKLLLGLPTYGRTYTLHNASNHGLHAPAIGKGCPGPVRGLTGVYSYQDVCSVLSDSDAVRVWDNQSDVPYLHAGTKWASYEDTKSAAKKCQYVRKTELGGVGIWALHFDDFSNMCQQGHFPLVTAVGGCLKGDNYVRF